MSDGEIQLAADGSGKMVDATTLTVGANTVYRQRIQLSGSTAAGLVEPLNSQPAGTEYAIPVREVADAKTSTGNAPTAASVGTTSSTILTSNTSRQGGIFVNTSTNIISFATGANAAVLNSGITLTPGGSWTMDAYSFTTNAIQAIASAASSNVAIQEFQ